MPLKENYFTYIYKVTNNNNFNSVKEYLTANYLYSSRLIRQIKRKGQILINDNKANLNDVIEEDDILTVILADEKLDSSPEDLPLDIVHEDDDILIVNKPPGLVTHPTRSHPSGNLANAIANHWQSIEISAKIRFVNRLDRDTSGVIIIAKNKYAHQYIQNEMKKGEVEKIYLAIVEGKLDNDEGIIDSPIGRPNEESIIREVMEEGKRAITYYKVIERFEKHTLLELKLETGRTHQIRVHLKSINHPIVGDSLYNGLSPFICRQALHAKSISFRHSRIHKKMEFVAELPNDINNLIKRITD